MSVDWSQTKAYALGTGQVYLNLAGRESQGIVKPSEKKALLAQIQSGLVGLRDADKDNASLHRIPRADVVRAVLAAGFELAGEGQMLRHPEDDLSKSVFAEGMRGNTDRFVLLLRKPSAR